MGLIKTITIGGEKYDIAAAVKIAENGGLIEKDDGINIYTGRGLELSPNGNLNVKTNYGIGFYNDALVLNFRGDMGLNIVGNSLAVTVKENGGIGIDSTYGLYATGGGKTTPKFDTNTMNWLKSYVLGSEGTHTYVYGVKYHPYMFRANNWGSGLELKYKGSDFYFDTNNGLCLANPSGGGGGGGGISGVRDIRFNNGDVYFASGSLDADGYISLQSNFAFLPTGDSLKSVYASTLYPSSMAGQTALGFGSYGNGIAIKLANRSEGLNDGLPLCFNSKGAISLRSIGYASPQGENTGLYSALQSSGNALLINLYTLAAQLKDFMEVKDGTLVNKFDRTE